MTRESARPPLPSRRSAFLGLLLGCSDGTGPDSDRVCATPLQVTATQSVTPVVTWAGGCRVNQVVFLQDEPQSSLAWVVYYTPSDSNGLLPPVQYGTVPSGAQQLPETPTPLQPGATYIINVVIWDTASGGSPVIVGRDTIVP